MPRLLLQSSFLFILLILNLTTSALVQTQSTITSLVSYGSSVTSDFRTVNVRLTPPPFSQMHFELSSIMFYWSSEDKENDHKVPYFYHITCVREGDAYVTGYTESSSTKPLDIPTKRNCVDGVDIHILLVISLGNLGNHKCKAQGDSPTTYYCRSELIFRYRVKKNPEQLTQNIRLPNGLQRDHFDNHRNHGDNDDDDDELEPDSHSVFVDWNPCSDAAIQRYNLADSRISLLNDESPQYGTNPNPKHNCAIGDPMEGAIHSGYLSQDPHTRLFTMNHPAVILEEFSTYDYGLKASIYQEAPQIVPLEQPIPQFHFRLHLTIPRPLIKGQCEHYFEILAPQWFEYTTRGFHDSLITRQNVHFPPQYPNHPQYQIHHDDDFKRTYRQQQLIESNKPYCLISGIMPVEITFNPDKPYMFKLSFDLYDPRYDRVFNTLAMRFISVRCYNFAIKTVAPVGYRTHHLTHARMVEIMVHQHHNQDEENQVLHNQILRNDAFSFLHTHSTLTRWFHPQLHAPRPTEMIIPSSLECTHQLGFNTQKGFVRCVVSDVTGKIHQQLKNIRFILQLFIGSELHVRYTVRQLSLSDSMHLNQNRHLSTDDIKRVNPWTLRSKYAPLLAEYQGCATTVLTQEVVCFHSTKTDADPYAPSTDSWINPYGFEFVDFDPSAPIIVDFFIEGIDWNSAVKYPSVLIGLQKQDAESASQAHLMYPITLLPNLSTTSAGDVSWDSDHQQWVPEKTFTHWAYKFTIKSSTHVLHSFQYEYEITPPQLPPEVKPKDVIADFINVFFPTRNLIFGTDSVGCWLESNSSSGSGSVRTKVVHKFGQFRDQIAANLTQMTTFSDSDIDSPAFQDVDTSYADVLIIDMFGAAPRIPFSGSTTVGCDILTARNPAYNPPNEPLVSTHSLVSIVFQTQDPPSLTSGPNTTWDGSDYHQEHLHTQDGSKLNRFEEHQVSARGAADKLYVFSQTMVPYWYNSPDDSRETGDHPIFWSLVAFGCSAFLLLITAAICFNREQFMALIKRMLLCCCPCITRKPPQKQTLDQPTLKSLKTAKYKQFSAAIQKKILLRQQSQAAAAIKANKLTYGGVGKFDVESGRFITDAEQRKAQQETLAQIQQRQVQFALTKQQSTKKQKAGEKLAQRSRDQDDIAMLLANRGRHAVPLANELDPSGKLRKRQSLYR